LSAADLEDSLRAAAAKWSFPTVPCTSLRVEVTRPEHKQRAEQDGKSVVMFRRSRWCHNERCGKASTFAIGAAAMTTVYPKNAGPGSVTEADIELNAVHLAWRDGRVGKPVAPLDAVLLHEIGHAIGLPDTPSSPDGTPGVMRPSRATELTPADIARVCAAFPR
jgi:hypothetical protein